MEALGAVGSVVGIISLGIQIAQILQAQINTVRDADARLLQVVWEIQATASALSNLQDLLLEDKDPENRIFSDGGHHDIDCIIRRCDHVFRNITALIAKTGKAALAKVDEFQRQIQNDTEQRNSISAAKLTIELSSLEHLLWPWKLPKIEQSIADLDRLKASLILMLSVAMLAKEKKRRLKMNRSEDSISSTSSQTVFEGKEEAALVDELFYKNLEYNEAEQKCDRILRADTLPPLAIGAPVNDGLAALQLLQRWSALADANDVPSVSELLKLNIVLEAYSIEFDDRQSHWVRVPLTLAAIREKAIEAHKQSTSRLIDTFTQLPIYQQLTITSLLDTIRSHHRAQKHQYNHDSPTLLALITPVRKARRSRRFVSKLICLSCLHISEQIKPNIFLIIGRFNEDLASDESTKPSNSEGLTHANTFPNSNGAPTYHADALNHPFVQGLYSPATYSGVPYGSWPNPAVPYSGEPYTPYVTQPNAAYNAEPYHSSPYAIDARDNGGTVHTIPTGQPSYASQPPVPLTQQMVTSTPGIPSETRLIEPEATRGGYPQTAISLPIHPPPISSSWIVRPPDLPSQQSQQLQLMRPDPTQRRPIASVFGREIMPLPAPSMSFSKEEKSSVACYYLEKWTTIFDHLTDDVRRRMRHSLGQRRLETGYQGPGIPFSTQENHHGNLGLEFPQNNRLMPPQNDNEELSMSLSNPDDQHSTRPSRASQARAAVHQSTPVTRDLPPGGGRRGVPPLPASQTSSFQPMTLPTKPQPPLPIPNYYGFAPTSYPVASMPTSTFGDSSTRPASIVPTMVPEAVQYQDNPKRHTPIAPRRHSSVVASDPHSRSPPSRIKRSLPLSSTSTSQMANMSGRPRKKKQIYLEKNVSESDKSNLPSTSRIPVTVVNSPNTRREIEYRQEERPRTTAVGDVMEEIIPADTYVSTRPKIREEKSKTRFPVTVVDGSRNISRRGAKYRQEGKSGSTAVGEAMEEIVPADTYVSAKLKNREEKPKLIFERDPPENTVSWTGSSETHAFTDADEIKPLSTASRTRSGYEKPSVVEEADEETHVVPIPYE